MVNQEDQNHLVIHLIEDQVNVKHPFDHHQVLIEIGLVSFQSLIEYDVQ